MGRCGLSSDGVTGGVVAAVLAGREALSGWLPVVVQAVRTADAAASEKARRLRREVGCVNGFSNYGAGSCEGYRAAAIKRTGSPVAILQRRSEAEWQRAHIINQRPSAALRE